jgi:hypothetical protein
MTPLHSVYTLPSSRGAGFFPFLDLPAELRIEIYRYSLVSGAHFVPRGSLPALHSLRFRLDKRPKLLRERGQANSITVCKSYECRQRLIEHEHAIEPIRAHDFAFGLFLTSKAISHDAVRIFFQETHFVFESRFELHIFLKTSRHVGLMKSLTLNMLKSHGPHSRQMKARFTTWKLRSERFWGPTVSDSIRELVRVCPAITYMELVDDRRCNAMQDSTDLRTGRYTDLKEVQCLSKLALHGFSYLLPDEERYKALIAAGLISPRLNTAFTSFFDWPLQQQNVLREAIEAHIRNSIAERANNRQTLGANVQL